MNFDPSYENGADVQDFESEEDEPVVKKEDRNVDHFLYRDLKEEQAQSLDEYIQWHKDHPHTCTPRKRRGNLDHAEAAGTLFEVEDQPGMIYLQTAGARKAEIPPEFQPSKIGINARMKEVNELAHKREHILRIEQRVDFDDPWWAYSVRDQASIHHVREDKVADDGSGYMPEVFSIVSDVQTELEKKKAERERRRKEREDQLAISAYWGKPTRLNKSARKARLVRSKYTVDGNEELGEYNAMEFEKEVTEALAEFNSNEASNALQGGPKGLSKKELELQEMLTTYKNTLGGDDAIDKIGEDFIKLATQTRKKKDGGKSIFDGGLDFLDACMKVNAAKAVPLLTFGADPNTVTEEEEPVLFMLLCKVLISDATRGSKADNKDDKERKSCMKILDALAKHGANLNCVVGEDKEIPLHKAAASGNDDIVLWLLENGARPNFRHPRTGATPIMMASKYAFPQCVANLIKYDAKIDARDDDGSTALHYAAASGQAKMCKFLLRLGADRDIRDRDGKTAAQLAVDSYSMTVAQTISGYAPKFRPISEPLHYLNKKILNGNESRSIVGKMLGGIGKAFSGAFKAIGNIFGGGDDDKIGCWEAMNDKFTEWHRNYQDSESFFDWMCGPAAGAPIHPEELLAIEDERRGAEEKEETSL